MDEQKEKRLRQYLDGELDDEQQKEVLHMIAEDSEMRSMLNFERYLQRSVRHLGEQQSYEVPENFSSGVMQALEKKKEQERESSDSLLDKVQKLLQVLWKPKTVQLRPGYAVAGLLGIILLISGPLSPDFSQTGNETNQSGTYESETVQQVSDGTDQVWTRFVYIDENAESVAVAGDFSNWEPVPLSKKNINGEQVWTGLIPMQKGEHRYMFVKNGEQWVTDPFASNYQEDGFGNKNAVIYL